MTIIKKKKYIDIIRHKRIRRGNVIKYVKKAFSKNPNSDGNMMEFLDDFIHKEIVFDSKGRTTKPLNYNKIIRMFLNSLNK